jgi:hypothetical protein
MQDRRRHVITIADVSSRAERHIQSPYRSWPGNASVRVLRPGHSRADRSDIRVRKAPQRNRVAEPYFRRRHRPNAIVVCSRAPSRGRKFIFDGTCVSPERDQCRRGRFFLLFMMSIHARVVRLHRGRWPRLFNLQDRVSETGQSKHLARDCYTLRQTCPALH